MSQFVLASASPRRRQLLDSLGLRFTVDPAHVDESMLVGESPEEHTLRLAADKAGKVALRHPDMWVLGADTAVVIDGNLLGKPEDEEDAVRMLSMIQGKTHTVYTGFAFHRHSDKVSAQGVVSSAVHVRSLTLEQTRWYVSTGEPMDKAGAYAIQGIGSCIVESVKGSYTNVVGLPLAEVVRTAERLGIFQLTDLR